MCVSASVFVYPPFTHRSASRSPHRYAEYDAYGKQSNFTSVYLYELFDLATDPYELDNIYAVASDELKQELHAAVTSYYSCGGPSCM